MDVHKDVIVHTLQVVHAVVDVMAEHGLIIQDMVVHIHMLWAEQHITKVIPDEADWCRYHGAKYV